LNRVSATKQGAVVRGCMPAFACRYAGCNRSCWRP